MYNFDEIIDRHGSCCCSVDGLEKNFGRKDLTSLWIADMDFKTPDFVIDALKARLDHPILGYPYFCKEYYEMISSWVFGLHNWKVSADDIRYIPGIVKGFAFAQRCFLKPGDKVIIMPPVYHPFRITTQKCGFEIVNNPLIPVYDEEGFLKTYEIDIEGLKSNIDSSVKLLMLCNPQNPCGVCFSRESLIELAKICNERGVLVISDEIHAEMMLGGKTHTPFASVSEEAANCSISFMAPSKTFNIAGVVSSYCIVSNPELKAKFFAYLDSCELDYPSIFSVVATCAAYTEKGKAWRKEMLAYIEANIDFVSDYLAKNIPCIHAVRPQASFVIWLDCRKLGLTQEELVDLFVNDAHLALNDGSMFGSEGTGFMRLNIGCPRSKLTAALESLKVACEKVKK